MPPDPFAYLRPGRGNARRGAGATTLDAPATRTAKRASARSKVTTRADPGVVASLLSALVEVVDGQNLAAIIPAVANLLSDRLGISATGDFQDTIGAALYTLVTPDGRTVTPPQVEREPHQRSLTAGALGVSPNTTINRTTPRVRRKFDEFAAALSDGRTLAAVLGDGDDGLPPGAVEVFTAAFTAIRNALIAGDTAAVQQAGADMAAMLVALQRVVTLGSQTTERAVSHRKMERVGKNHWAAPGYRVSRKSLPRISGIQVGGETLPPDQVAFADGRPRRRIRLTGRFSFRRPPPILAPAVNCTP